MPKVIQVIKSDTVRGKGNNVLDAVREVITYHTLAGQLLAESDVERDERAACWKCVEERIQAFYPHLIGKETSRTAILEWVLNKLNGESDRS